MTIKFQMADDIDQLGSARQFTLTRFNDVTLSTSAVYLVKNLIPRAGLIIVWGPPKCGKSFWTFDVSMHIARGEPYRDRPVQQGTVVYLALEGANGFRRRIEAYRGAHDVTESPFYLITDRVDLIRDHRALIDCIRGAVNTDDGVPAIVVVDTLNRSLAGSESSDEDMAAYIQAADAIRAAFDCAIVIVHHCGIDGTRPRGHTSLTGAVEAQIAVTRDDDKNIVVEVEWLKDGIEGDHIISELETVTVGVDDDGEAITSCVVRPVDGASRLDQPPSAGKKKGHSEPKSLRTFRAAFTEALDTMGKIIRVRSDGPEVRAVNVSDVRWEFNKRWATGETDPQKRSQTQRQAFSRLLKTLPTEFVTSVQDQTEWIWKTPQ
jgi:hypothetical protein